jgi:nicotinamidase-related amidase
MIVDIQERLVQAIPEATARRCIQMTKALIAVARLADAAIVVTEQYPRGLGPTVSELNGALGEAAVTRLEKVHFDVCQHPGFVDLGLDAIRSNIVVCGMEAHICVLSTATSLLGRGHRVLIPFDAVASRNPAYQENGMEEMRRIGAIVSNAESLLFETLGSSKHPQFRAVSKMIL